MKLFKFQSLLFIILNQSLEISPSILVKIGPYNNTNKKLNVNNYTHNYLVNQDFTFETDNNSDYFPTSFSNFHKKNIVPSAYRLGKYHHQHEIPNKHQRNKIPNPTRLRGKVDYGAFKYGRTQAKSPHPSSAIPSLTATASFSNSQIRNFNSNTQTSRFPSFGDDDENYEREFRGTFRSLFDLDDLNVFKNWITLSGYSSGGGLAQQLFVSYSSLFSGLAIFQQTFYRCGRGNGILSEFDAFCTNLVNQSESRPYDPNLAINDIRSYFRYGLIDDPMNLRNKPLYVYAGLNNTIFRPEMMLSVIQVFEPFIQNPFNMRTRVQNAESHLPTENFGAPCSQPAMDSFFLGNCNLNGPYDALSFLIGVDTIRLPSKNVEADLNSLLEFDQSEFFNDFDASHNNENHSPHSMAATGYLYLPRKCHPRTKVKCLLHIYFHGCLAGADVTDGNHIRFSGFLELAELNNMIILFPQIQTNPQNMLGCWDSYGYTGPLYATQRGVQVSVMRRILSRILDDSS